jgi:hydrogenase maturation protein HypF
MPAAVDKYEASVAGRALTAMVPTSDVCIRVRRRLLVRGIVQGVGFRPYVHGLAASLDLAGFVRNTPTGAEIEIEGSAGSVKAFLANLSGHGPRLMRVDAIDEIVLPAAGEYTFQIRESELSEDAFTFVPPDICVCEECIAETRDPLNRRFEYPFANCTNCGPRYSIVESTPYDRAQTTMADFTMCDDCQREYNDPDDRHFHAQPNACPACGPQLQLVVAGQEQRDLNAREVLGAVAKVLLNGKIVALKGLGGVQLACDARNSSALRELRRRKHRSEKPFAIMVRDQHVARQLCFVDPAELTTLLAPERPIVLLARRINARLAPEIAFASCTLGLMLPATPMHELLFCMLREQAGIDIPLVMTSGNLSQEPIAIENDDALRSLAEVADAFVLHNRRIHTRVDDSVVRVVFGQPTLVRRARGYAPNPIPLGRREAEVLACGAHQKSTLCLTTAGFGLLSQHLGDLENYETLQFFEQTLDRMSRLFHVQPRIVAHDLHPGYLSSQFAMKFPAERRIAVQHHHAHIAACMAEHGLKGPVIGIAWDGTGLGTDNTIWGGEFLIADYSGFERAAHLRGVLLPGGDAAVREPWRIARSYLHDALGTNTVDTVLPPDETFAPSIPQSSLHTIDAMLRRRLHVVETSSCGRLFDAVASLTGLHQTVSYEGQGAIALEDIAAPDIHGRYDFLVVPLAGSPAQVDTRPMVRQIISDVERGVRTSHISARFHNTLATIAVEVCGHLRSQHSLHRVCLGGGCFQNMRLLRSCVDGLRASGFDVFYPQRVPTNDGGIALGQAAIACELVSRGA